MARRKFQTESLTVNLVAATDITFQLLLFFMLSTDLSQRSLLTTAELLVPKVSSYIEEVGREEEFNTLIINVVHKNEECDKLKNKEVCADRDPFYRSPGYVCEDPSHWQYEHGGSPIKQDVLLKTLKNFAQLGKSKGKDTSENSIIIRADKRTPYIVIADLMMYIAKAKIYKVKTYVDKKGR